MLRFGYCQNLISHFQYLPQKQLLDTANYYYGKNSLDTAFVCYSLIVNTPVNYNDFEQLKRIVFAHNRAAIIYYQMNDFHASYELLIQTLHLCEQYNYPDYIPKIYTNIGNIYYRFKEYGIAKTYYAKALELSQDSTTIVILNNLGAIEVEFERQDSALYFLNKALHLSKLNRNAFISVILNTKASLYQKVNLYDSAFHYYRLSYKAAIKNNKNRGKAKNLSDIGNLFFKTNKLDSAVFYMNLSNKEATANNFLGILAENYRTLSKIEESKGRKTAALEYYKKYTGLKDSIFGVEKFADINQLQRRYEVSKTNRQIELLVVEQQLKERTIYYQKIIWLITLVILLIVSGALLLLFFQNKRLNRAYKALFEKNIKILELQKSPKSDSEKYQKSALTDEMQDEILNKILTLMEDTEIICDTEFSLDKLSELVHSNQTYVSQVINTALKKNFRSFLNSYRIQEAQRLFSELDLTKYTIAAIAHSVGFKSPAAFRSTFKEITGVSPIFYLKQMQKQSE